MSSIFTISLPSLLASFIFGSIILKTGSVFLKVMLSFVWMIILFFPVFELNPEFYLLFLLLIVLCLVSYLFKNKMKRTYQPHGLQHSLFFILYVTVLSNISFTIITEKTDLLHKPDTIFFILFMLILVLLVKNLLLKDRHEYED